MMLLRDEEMRHGYEAAAAATAQQYDWSVITEVFVEALRKTIRIAAHTNTIPERAVEANA